MIYRHEDYPHIVMELSKDRIAAECEECNSKDTLVFELAKDQSKTVLLFRKFIHEWKIDHIGCRKVVH